MRKILTTIVIMAICAIAPRAMALDCRYDQHVEHQITLKGTDGKISYWGSPRELILVCASGRRDRETWVLDGFPGEYPSAQAAIDKVHAIRTMLGAFDEDQWHKAVAFVKKALTEGTQGGKLFAEK